MTRVLRLRHQALDPEPDGVGCSAIRRLTASDRERAAFLVQGLALLAHLRAARWRLDDWTDARVDARGVLRVAPGAVAAVADDRLPQDVARDLVVLLFGSEDLPGRSPVRAAFRPAVARWQDRLLPVSPNRVIVDLLERAPFLWGREFPAVGSSLFAVVEDESGSHVVVAGRPAWRRTLARTDEEEIRGLAGDRDRTRLFWRRARDAAAGDRSGDRRSGGIAPAGADPSDQAPLPSPEERSAEARRLLGRGRFESALSLLRGSERTDDLVLRLRGQIFLGSATAARRTLGRLEKRTLSGRQAAERRETAVELHAATGAAPQLRSWAGRLGADAGRARAFRALACWELGEIRAMEGLLLPDGEARRTWVELLVRARLARARGRFAEAERLLASGLARGRERLTLRRRADLWKELATLRLSVNDLVGAERAACISVGLLRRCEGPVARSAAHGDLVEIRIRKGWLAGVAETIAGMKREGRLAGNLRRVLEARVLEARLVLARGESAAALDCCRMAQENLRGPRTHWQLGRALHLLTARALVHLGRREEAATELAALLERPVVAFCPAELDDLLPLLLSTGLRDAAAGLAAVGEGASVWSAVLEGGSPSAEAWRQVEARGSLRGASMVHDLITLGVRGAPAGLLDRAVRAFVAVGAEALAQRVDCTRVGPWRALAAFLAAPDPDPETCRKLMAAGGHPEARIEVIWSGRDAQPGIAEPEVLVAGPGGSDRFTVDAAVGRLSLVADDVDEPTRVLASAIATRLSSGSRRRLAVSELAEPGRTSASGMVGRSQALRNALALVERLAAHDLPVLILGESGTGKELLARRLHGSSARASRPWLAVNCAALPESLLLSDLFGHSRGAFTGADRDRIGVFESADGGTVFLDEIGELPWAAQGMLLRLLQEGEMRRVGESRTRRLNFRLVAATHRDLAAMVESGSFREDLYFRLRVAWVEAPPLRERGGDVMLLARHFLDAAAGERRLTFDDSAVQRLQSHSWPGNVRELKNTVDRAAALVEGTEIPVEMLGLPDLANNDVSDDVSGDYRLRMERYRRRLITSALAESGGNQARAARALGLSRQALSYHVRRLDGAALAKDAVQSSDH